LAVFLDGFFSFDDAWAEDALDSLLVFAEAGTAARPMPSRIDAATAVNVCSFFEFISSSFYNICG
jgi:hypothetical protein